MGSTVEFLVVETVGEAMVGDVEGVSEGTFVGALVVGKPDGAVVGAAVDGEADCAY